ncbi:unnamed protein product, partial [Prunus brigantina]
LAQEENDELLDGSLRLLDVCSVAKDTLLQTKECTIEILSIIRRRRGGKTELASEVKKFLTIRKVMKKAVCKALGNLKGSLLSFISGPKSQPSSWSLVSKMMQSKKVACEEATEINEFAEVDAVLNSLIGHKASKRSADDAHNQLDQLESCIQDQEQGLECLFRQMIKTRECMQDLQSIMRRRRGSESGALTTEVRKYLTSRKMVKKAIHKAMGNLRGSSFSSLNEDNETIAVVSTLRDVEAVTLSVFESLLSFISGPKSKPSSSWSLVSKIIHTKRVAFACEEEAEANEFAQVDAALNFIGHKTSKSQHQNVDNVQNQLNKLEACIQDQEGLECLFRQLIKTRVSLLNVLNQ